MKVFYSFSEADGKVSNSVVTIGMFDGVHAGHKKIIGHVIKIADEINGESTLITFWPHPRQVLSNDNFSHKLINTLEEKIELLRKTGLKNLIVHPFTIDFSKTSGSFFLQNYVAKALKAKAIVVGKNHFFGHNRQGNFEVIKDFAKKYSLVARQIPLELIAQETISSAKIREAIAIGDLKKANNLLEYNYFITGYISKGH
jgi:riboflavin kinase/FMN adenylyltransferase